MAENPSSQIGNETTAGKPQVSSVPYLYDVSREIVPEKKTLHKFGANSAIDASEEVIMSQGGMINYLSSAEIPKIKSSSADDDGDPEGIGAWTVKIIGLDANWDEQEETVTLNGQTLVALANTYIRVNRMYVVTGSVPVNANIGTITLYQNDGTTAMVVIAPARGQSQFCAWTVPNGKTLFVNSFGISEVNNKRIRARLYIRDNTVTNSVFRVQDETAAVAGQAIHHFEAPAKITQKTDIELRGVSDVIGSDVTGHFEGWYENE